MYRSGTKNVAKNCKTCVSEYVRLFLLSLLKIFRYSLFSDILGDFVRKLKFDGSLKCVKKKSTNKSKSNVPLMNGLSCD